MIRVDDLVKTFRVHRRPPGLRATLRSIFRRKYEVVRAVGGVTFRIERGERVGFLGPNGAGKTTTLKVLSGLLHPTAGAVSVDGTEPRRREAAFLKRITLVMGQKNQLIWDLPASETYALNRALFDVPRAEFDETLRELDDLLGLSGLSSKPVRQLSLGERMKCELAAALLEVKERVGFCSVCFDLSEGDPCRRCKDPHRDATHLCAVATPQDLLAIDRTGAFRGRYHVLGGVLSPLEGVGPNELKVRELIARLADGTCKEMILATPPTVEGDATALYISKLIKPIGVKVTRLAMGLPVGGELEYADQVTLGRALEGRREL